MLYLIRGGAIPQHEIKQQFSKIVIRIQLEDENPLDTEISEKPILKKLKARALNMHPRTTHLINFRVSDNGGQASGLAVKAIPSFQNN